MPHQDAQVIAVSAHIAETDRLKVFEDTDRKDKYVVLAGASG